MDSPRKPKPLSEAWHQSSVLKWSQQPDIRRKWPELALLLHIPNEGARTGQSGAVLKHAGLKRGVPDLVLPVARGPYHGLFIEMKRPGARTDSKHAAEQQWWLEKLSCENYCARECYGWEAAVELLAWYLGMEATP